ncbi:MAG: hypothetical protein IV094_13590 [Vitreoscilla sp.]|nr:hypothetical protein [Vitreoscilla sp.]
MLCLLLATLPWLPGSGFAEQRLTRVSVADARSLLVAAIDAPDGQAHGVLSGQIADAITQRFKATTPIYIDVTTERRYAQAGCRRLQARFWQDGVQLPGLAAPRRQTVDFGINYCRDGLPPKSLQEERP